MPVGAGREPFDTVVDVFRHAVLTVPDRVALHQGACSLTYREYGQCVAALAARLEALGASGGRVAVVLPNGPELAVGIFAALSARAQVALLDPGHPAAELGPLLTDVAPAAVLADGDAEAVEAGYAAEHRVPVLILGGAGLALRRLRDEGADVPQSAGPLPDELATLMYTGGSTGVPKGADHTHRTLMLAVQAVEACWPTRPDGEVWLAVAPMVRVWGLLMGVLGPVYGRAAVVSLPRFEPGPVAEALRRHRVTVFSGGPAAVYARLLETGALTPSGLPHLRVCPGGGSPFPVDLLHRWQRATGVPIREAFGMTELAPITGQPPDAPPRPGSVGRPAPLVDIRIAGDDGTRPLPPGTPGEILVRAPHLFRGYRNRPEETAAVLTDGWLRTGDLGRLDEDGYLHIVGRKKDMIIVGGSKVYPREIDDVLTTHPGVLQAVTIGVPDPRTGERPVSFVVPEPDRPPDLDELYKHCGVQLAAYKLPGSIAMVRQIPLTAAGKIDRQALHVLWNACPAPHAHQS